MNKRIKFALSLIVYTIGNLSMYFVNYHFELRSNLLICGSVLATFIGVMAFICIMYGHDFDIYTTRPKKVVITKKTEGRLAIETDGEFWTVCDDSPVFYKLTENNKKELSIEVKRNFWGLVNSERLVIDVELSDQPYINPKHNSRRSQG